MNIIGIDPGKSGAIVSMTDDGNFIAECRLSDTPADVWNWLDAVHRNGRHAFVEKVSSSPQMGVTSAFTFGRGVGFLEGILTAAGIPFEYVAPQKWQKAMGCLTGGDKNKSKAAAQRLWPGAKIAHWNADARLIAEYGRRVLNERNR